MPKQIKFNLVIDKKPIRDIEDLQENFNIEDLLEAYKNGSLKRWLLVRGMIEQAEQLDKITGDDVMEAALELCRIFDSGCSKEQLQHAVYPFEIKQKYFEKLEQMMSLQNQRDEIIRSYHGGYEKLLSDIEAQWDNYPFIRTAIMHIYENYYGLFTMNVYHFYNQFIFDYPLVILATLANSEMRTLLTQISNEQEIFEHITNPKNITDSYALRYKQKLPIPFTKLCQTNADLEELQKKMSSVFVLEFSTDSQSYSSSGSALKIFKTESLKPPFVYVDNNFGNYPPYVQSYSGKTEGYWKDLEQKGRWMIISMESGNFIRSAGKNGEELKAEDVNGKFPILEGVDYKSNNDSSQLIYMEV